MYARISQRNNHTNLKPHGTLVYSRLIAAAVVNPRFCQHLLENPDKALETGYGGERFYLPTEVRAKVAAIRALTLTDFARQLVQIQDASLDNPFVKPGGD